MHGWNHPWTGAIAADWMEPDIYMDLARALEHACFDCLIIEDGSFIADAYQCCDGFIVWPTVFPGMFEEFGRLVVPELQRRGLFRTEYQGSTLRENLRSP